MNFVSARNHAAPALLLAVVLGLSFSSAACGRTACFTWSSGEGACPAQQDALAFFTSAQCTSNVVSVDSEGSPDFDGRLCCYAVTENDIHFDEGLGNACESGSSSSGIAPGSGAVGAGGAFGGSAVSTSVGVGGSTTGCVSCVTALNDPMAASAGPLCPASAELFVSLLQCACQDACAAACAQESICMMGGIPGAGCVACLQDPKAGCADALNACNNDP